MYRSVLTDISDGAINGDILLQFIRQYQEHVTKAYQDMCSENEDMDVKPHVHPQ
jgi:hypothetical protein